MCLVLHYCFWSAYENDPSEGLPYWKLTFKKTSWFDDVSYLSRSIGRLRLWSIAEESEEGHWFIQEQGISLRIW